MATRNITVTFSDGSKEEYTGIPVDKTPEDIEADVKQQFPYKEITNINSDAVVEEQTQRDSTALVSAEPVQSALAEDPEQQLLAGQTAQGDTKEEATRQLGLTARSLIRGNLGSASTVGMAADAFNASINTVFGTNLGTVTGLMDNIADTFGVPKNEKERAVAAASDTVASLLTGGGIKKAADWILKNLDVPASKAFQLAQEFGKKLGIQAAISAPSSAAAQYVSEKTDSPAAGLAAGVVIALTGGRAANMVKAGAASPARASEKFGEASGFYEQSKQSKAGFRSVTAKGGDNIPDSIVRQVKEDLDASALPLDDDNLKRFSKYFSEFENTVNELTKQGKPIPISLVVKLRDRASSLIEGAGANRDQRKAAYFLREAIDGIFGRLTKQDVVGSAEDVKLFDQGRRSWRTASRMGILERVIDDAMENTKIGEGKSFKVELQRSLEKLLKDKKKLKMNFTEEEIKTLQKVSQGNGWSKLANGVGVFAGLAGRFAAVTEAVQGNLAGALIYPAAAKSQEMLRQLAARQQRMATSRVAQNIAAAKQPQTQVQPGDVGMLMGVMPSYAPGATEEVLKRVGLLQTQ